MTPELDPEPGLGGAPADHAIGVDAVHRLIAEAAASAECGTEQGALVVVANADRQKVFIDVGLSLWCAGISWGLPLFSCRRSHRRLPSG